MAVTKAQKEQLNNFTAYGFYRELVENGVQSVDAHIFTRKNIDDHFNSIIAILSDGIETEYVQRMMVHLIFTDGEYADLTIAEYMFCLMFFTLPLEAGQEIDSDKLFWVQDITQDEICKYINNKFIKRYRTILPFMQLNQTIDTIYTKFRDIRKFQPYLMNTVNLKDTIDLMTKYKEFYNAVHCDATGVPIEDVKEFGMKAANTQVKYIINSEHCLRDSFRTGEGINTKQFKEVQAHIGTKPNGKGSVYPTIINSSFITGGLRTPADMIIESSIGRQAQILSMNNVGSSGSFARLLGLNCMNTTLHKDPTYSCDTRNFIKVFIADKGILDSFDMRYYRLQEDGIDHRLDADKDKHLIGQTIFVRSPMTCQSYAKGHGICYKCYGDLAYVNRNINIGKIAAEEQSSRFTQRLLSAKHLLESSVIKLDWEGPLSEFFDISYDSICMRSDVDYTNYFIKIDSLETDDEYDDIEFNYSVSSFSVIYPDGSEREIKTTDSDNIYLIPEFATLVLKVFNSCEDNEPAIIPFDDLQSIQALFKVPIKNNELQATMDKIVSIINVKKITSTYTKDAILEDFMNTNMKGGIKLSSVHYEVILANQFRDKDNILEYPDWSVPNTDNYQILTLSSSLMDSPFLMTRLLYSRLNKVLIKPSTFEVNRGSVNDLFMVKYPKQFIDSEPIDPDEKDDSIMIDGKKKINPFVQFESEEEYQRWIEKQMKQKH